MRADETTTPLGSTRLVCFPHGQQMYASCCLTLCSIVGGPRSANHFVQIRSSRHHRIDGVFLLDLELNQARARMSPRCAHGGCNVGPLAHLERAHPKCLS